jgi:redox-sensitive bicupin YhaK (pirin superfamily)
MTGLGASSAQQAALYLAIQLEESVGRCGKHGWFGCSFITLFATRPQCFAEIFPRPKPSLNMQRNAASFTTSREVINEPHDPAHDRAEEQLMKSDATQKQPDPAHGSVEKLINTRARELVDGFKVRRALPAIGRRMVGPFIFLDQMGPEILKTGEGLDVAPHPHIGLATVTYLFKGELLHRDSLGTVQPIRPGEVNWMTAGRGITHSERTPPEMRQTGSELFGIQTWVAFPTHVEETEPAFAHHSAGELPSVEGEGKLVRLICGSLYGARSPVRTFSEMFYADAALERDARLQLPAGQEERAAYIVEGTLELLPDGGTFTAGQLLIFKPGAEIILCARGSASARLMLLGGAPLDGTRHIWWNFVSSSRERIEQAKEDWKNGRFAPVPEETESIPLPGSGPALVRYP